MNLMRIWPCTPGMIPSPLPSGQFLGLSPVLRGVLPYRLPSGLSPVLEGMPGDRLQGVLPSGQWGMQ